MERTNAARTNMVNGQVITVGVTDRRLIAAMLSIPRHRFVPAATKPFAYIDADLKLNEASQASPSRYLMPAGPFARLVQAARIRRTDTVLDVGCATGYSSAVMARLASAVIALESDEELAAFATEALIDLAIDNVAVVTGSLASGWPDARPFDVILIGGSVERIPSCLVSQLAVGGRLATIVGSGFAGSAHVYHKSRGHFSGRAVFNVAARPLPGFEEPKAFVF